jgi:hypothetical protein
MVMPTNYISTENFPHTHSLLKKSLPSIFLSECINDKNNTFSQEVRNTEIPHLFEHILLANLCRYYTITAESTSEFSGWTSWNWITEVKGTFDIEISGNFSQPISISEVIFQSIDILDEIFLYHSVPLATTTSL